MCHVQRYCVDACALLILFGSLDAIDCTLPHTADNVQWVCARINFGTARALLRFVCLLTWLILCT